MFLFFLRLSKCSLDPCPNTVDCFISRPTEKKIFMLFMVVSSALCILMCILEMVYLVCKRIIKLAKVRHENDRIMFAESHQLKTLSPPRSQFHADPTLADSKMSLSRREKTQREHKTTFL